MDWLNILQTVGLPIAGLVFVGWGLVKVVRWTGKEVVIPIRDRLIDRTVLFFDHLESHNHASGRTIELTYDVVCQIDEKLNTVSEIIRWKKPPSDPPGSGVKKVV